MFFFLLLEEEENDDSVRVLLKERRDNTHTHKRDSQKKNEHFLDEGVVSCGL